MNRICHIIFEHRIFDGRIFFKEAISLAQNGFEVIILAPTIDKKSLGLKKEAPLSENKTYESQGIKFHTYFYNKKLPKQLNIRQYFCKQDLLKKLKQIDADVYHFHEDGLTMEIAAQLKEILPGKKIVFDFHEFFIHSYREKKRKINRINEYIKLENKIVKQADLIITVTDFISAYYKTLCQCPIISLYNCQSEKIFPTSKENIVDDGIFWIVHEGRMLFDRGLKLIIEVARKLDHPNIKFLIIGNLAKAEERYFQNTTSQYQIQDKFHITGFLPYQEVPLWLKKGKVGLTFMLSDNAKTTISNKFFNYIRFGIPILSLHHPIIDDIIAEYEVGYVFDKNEAKEIAIQIKELYDNQKLWSKLKTNAEKAFKTTFNWKNMEQRLISAYYSILESK